MTGLLFVDKPAGITSHDVVSTVRRAARTKRVGHAGTLDPFATGLLVLAVGAGTRLLPYLAAEPKVYDATVRFGTETDTDDSTGVEVRAAAPPRPESVTAAFVALTGNLLQVPPAFSAKQVDGQRAYAVARRGGAVELPASPVTVHSWSLLAQRDDEIDVRITCGGGTYVRALARDLGRATHSAAHCSALRRIGSGAARVHDAVSCASLTPGAIADGTVALRGWLEFLEPMAVEVLGEDGLLALAHGRCVPATQAGARAALVHGAQVMAIAERIDDAQWQPRVVLLGARD
jgi:tRNA pseudouridine55 synthase